MWPSCLSFAPLPPLLSRIQPSQGQSGHDTPPLRTSQQPPLNSEWKPEALHLRARPRSPATPAPSLPSLLPLFPFLHHPDLLAVLKPQISYLRAFALAWNPPLACTALPEWFSHTSFKSSLTPCLLKEVFLWPPCLRSQPSASLHVHDLTTLLPFLLTRYPYLLIYLAYYLSSPPEYTLHESRDFCLFHSPLLRALPTAPGW